MAQAVFEEHPLEQYLRAAGELREPMPGISHALEEEIDIDRDLYILDETEEDSETELCPKFILAALNVIQTLISTAQPSDPSNPFAERFKYNVISSSLLSSSLSTPHTIRTSHSTSIPGRLHHSRTSSIEIEKPNSPTFVPQAEPQYGYISLSVLATAAFFGAGYVLLALLSFSTVLFLLYNLSNMTDTPSNDFTSTLQSLDELVAAYEVWESTVQDAIGVLEKEEHVMLRSPSTPALSPSSSVRVALHTTLQTTRTQCDNLRQLSSALTCPSELSQLSEMYAPPSPTNTKSPQLSVGDSSPRPFSFPSLPSHPQTPENKRSTWNGSYSSLAIAGSPTVRAFRRKDKHRTNVSTLFQTSSSQSTSPPVTPAPASPCIPLAKVVENNNTEDDDDSSFYTAQGSSPFGPAALDLQRKRKTGGMEAFTIPPESYFTPEMRSPRINRFSTTITSSSRFTTLQTPRHPLSLSALHHALQGALASKRYTCSHLLALRFKEDEDDGYWENARSIMDLLTSTFSDESSRLAEALEDLERQNLRDQHPTPNTSVEREDAGGRRRSSLDRVTFAPMPSHLSRFAAHVAAITSALDDAREHLEECVAALKGSNNPPQPKSLRHMQSISQLLKDDGPEEPQALQAYERLRRELGLALRECERGRQKLVDIVHPPSVSSDDSDDSDDLPSFGHDVSDESDKPDPISPSEDEEEPTRDGARTVPNPDIIDVPLDDTTSHLLLSTSVQHLPSPGIEQVFEADVGGRISYARERSKLSREERIKLMKARRESGVGGMDTVSYSPSEKSEHTGIEKWGPGGEVVQELKDVIWKVAERRRKMQDGHDQDS